MNTFSDFLLFMKPVWHTAVAFAGIRLLLGLPWGLCCKPGASRATVHSPVFGREVSIYFVLGTLAAELGYLGAFHPSYMLLVSCGCFGVGVPLGVIGLIVYTWAQKRRVKGESMSPYVEETDDEDLCAKITAGTWVKACLGFSAVLLACFIWWGVMSPSLEK